MKQEIKLLWRLVVGSGWWGEGLAFPPLGRDDGPLDGVVENGEAECQKQGTVENRPHPVNGPRR